MYGTVCGLSGLWRNWSTLNRPGSPISPSPCSGFNHASVATTMSGTVLSMRGWNWPFLSETDLQLTLSSFSMALWCLLSFCFGGIGEDIASGVPGDIPGLCPSHRIVIRCVEFRTDRLKLGILQVRQCQLVFESSITIINNAFDVLTVSMVPLVACVTTDLFLLPVYRVLAYTTWESWFTCGAWVQFCIIHEHENNGVGQDIVSWRLLMFAVVGDNEGAYRFCRVSRWLARVGIPWCLSGWTVATTI